ncbi:MAG: hypothetical protein Aureis2KO_01760 [Aureisphaera sp.]
MELHNITSSYLEALRKGDLTAVIDLFSDEGIVISPIYGTMLATEFYERLFKDTQESTLTLKGIFQDIDQSYQFSIYFKYQWTLADGNKVSFDVVDVIKLNNENKITELTIIYDTSESRPAVAGL